ncbi:HD domain-containing protein [Puteibacter caeruleilacunae]|nr:HD domain-containing protein [Puteibacter caeruleilacunae]
MELVKNAESFVREYFKDNTDDRLVYHTLEHTEFVVEKAGEIAEAMNISEEDKQYLLVAAWFHDIGYFNDCCNHEVEGGKLVAKFLRNKNITEDKIQQIDNMILATKMPQTPKCELDRILCDADMAHTALDDFLDKSLKLWKEIENVKGKATPEDIYLEHTIFFMEKHKFHTQYALDNYNDLKQANILKLGKRVDKIRKNHKKQLKDKDKKILKLEEKISELRSPTRGVESMFRNTARNQISLSSIADNKANILISTNAIMLSVLITMIVRKINELPFILIPTVIFLVCCLTTIVFAILSTRPNVNYGSFSKEKIKASNTNMMFFGNFFHLNVDEYEEIIRDLMKDYDGLYSTMIKDQFFLGQVLAKKFKMLRIAYNVFMFGMITTVVAFSYVMIFNHP